MSPGASSSPVEALDALSERLLGAVAPLQVAPATRPDELAAVHRLRYAHVIEHGWARAGDLPGGLERDGFDDGALLIAAWDGARLAGTLRVVLPAAGRPLPVEAAFGIVVEPRGRVVDVGRLLIAPSYRGDPAHRIWGALFARAWLEIRARGYAVLAGAATAEHIERYAEMGMRFEVLGPCRRHWGELRHPVRLDPGRDGAPQWPV